MHHIHRVVSLVATKVAPHHTSITSHLLTKGKLGEDIGRMLTKGILTFARGMIWWSFTFDLLPIIRARLTPPAPHFNWEGIFGTKNLSCNTMSELTWWPTYTCASIWQRMARNVLNRMNHEHSAFIELLAPGEVEYLHSNKRPWLLGRLVPTPPH